MEELQKRNTDCVYFLASSFTCKKGIECEYRHSEIARVNPRDCRYWLAGSCLNPVCAFRHPPLESRIETSSDSVSPHHKSVMPVKKTNVPCYFYFNGYCSKGERCSFLHIPDDGSATYKSSKIEVGPLDEKKTSAGSKTGPTPVEGHPNSSEIGRNGAAPENINSKVDLGLMTNYVAEQSASPDISGSSSEEDTAVGLDSLVPAEGFSQGGYHLSSDRSSDEEAEDNVDRVEWLGPSGFDVLIDDKVEGLSYKNNLEYLLFHDTEDKELDGRVARYDFLNNLEYDRRLRILMEGELQQESYDDIENQDICEYIREIPISAHGRESVPWKRKFLPKELDFRGRRNVDLRDFLKKRRVIDGDATNHRRFDLSRSNALEQSVLRDQPQRSGWRHGRLASNVESNVPLAIVENDTLLDHQRRWSQSQVRNYRQSFKNRRRGRSHPCVSEVPGRTTSRKRLTEVRMIFNGPKTLSQIKEEKRKGREDGNSSERTRPSGASERGDFKGPKPLTEILNDKRRLSSVLSSDKPSN